MHLRDYRGGFVLIECLCYLAILSVVMIVVFPFAVSMHKNIVHTLGLQADIMDAHTALDLFALDINCAQGSRKAWKWADDSITFRTDTKDIRWIKHNNTLIRMSGTYKVADDTWVMREKSLVLERVSHFTCDLHEKDGYVTCVDVTIQVQRNNQRYQAQLAICPHNARVTV